MRSRQQAHRRPEGIMGDKPVLIPAASELIAPDASSAATPVPEPIEPVDAPVVEPPPPPPVPWWGTGPGRAALIVLLVFALAYTLQVTRELVLPIVVALLIAIVLSPIARFLRRLHFPHALAAGIVVLLFAGSVAAGIYALMDPAASWMERAPQTLRDVQKKLRKIRSPMAQAQQAAKQV